LKKNSKASKKSSKSNRSNSLRSHNKQPIKNSQIETKEIPVKKLEKEAVI